MICTRSSSLTRHIGRILAACAVLTLALAGGAEAAPNMWGPVMPLPIGSTPAGDELLSSPTGALLRYSLQEGRPSLATFESGVLGPASPLPNARFSGSEGELGPVSFLANGAAIMSFAPFKTANRALVYRSPTGVFGPVFESGSPSIVAFAARADEVLIVKQSSDSEGRPELIAASLAIGSEGKLTATGTPTVIYDTPAPPGTYYGTQVESVAVALDANGQADVVVNVDRVEYAKEVLDIARSAALTWGPPRNLAAGLFEEKHAGGLQVAVAPGGRAVLTFQDAKVPPGNSGGASQLADYVYQSVREPGGSFANPALIKSIEGKGGVEFKTQVAAGGDGTLALEVSSRSCQTFEDSSEVPAEAIGVLVAPPAKPLVGYEVPVLDTEGESTSVRIPNPVLGAGHGQALLGVTNHIITEGSKTNLCYAAPSEKRGRIEDRAVLVGGQHGGESTFASDEYEIGSQTTTADVSVEAAGLDTAGNGAITGSLATSKGKEYAFYTGEGSINGGREETPGGGAGGGGGSAPGGSAPGVSTGPAGGTTMTPGTTTPGHPPSTSGITTTGVVTSGGTVTVSGASVTLPAKVSCSSTPATPCTVTTTASIPQAGAATSSVTASAAHAKTKHGKSTTIGKGTMTLAGGATGSLHLTLTSHGLALLRSRHTLSITVTVAIAGQGRPVSTHTLHFQLKLKHAAKKAKKHH